VRNRALHRLLVDGVMVEYREVAGDVGDWASSGDGDTCTAREA